MNTIWFFGDSFTYGDGCLPGFEYYDKYPNEDTRIWTTRIAEEYNFIEKNLSERGCSTPMIINSLINNLSKIKPHDMVILSDSLPSRTLGVNSKRRKIELVTTDIFETHHGLDNFFEYEIERESFLNHIINNILPYENIWKTFYEKQIEALQTELLNRKVEFYFWSHSIWALRKDSFISIREHTNGKIDDGHFSWEGHSQMTKIISEAIKNKKYIIHKKLL